MNFYFIEIPESLALLIVSTIVDIGIGASWHRVAYILHEKHIVVVVAVAVVVGVVIVVDVVCVDGVAPFRSGNWLHDLLFILHK